MWKTGIANLIVKSSNSHWEDIEASRGAKGARLYQSSNKVVLVKRQHCLGRTTPFWYSDMAVLAQRHGCIGRITPFWWSDMAVLVQ
jgi:hypothetical protein